jgi:uncharacterized protein YecE (DUF72 family)
MTNPGTIRVGIGGWVFAPWRGEFYPPSLPAAQELGYASRRVTAIEINTTLRRTQTPDSFARWAAETPDDFVFTLKAPAHVVNRRVLAETGPGIARFLDSGLTQLGAKLGPILWQFAPTKVFDERDVQAFLSLLPRRHGGQDLRHAIEARHPSFVDPRFLALARSHNVALVVADSDVYPQIADVTGDFVYVRLQRGSDDEPLGYREAALDLWAERARIWAAGGEPVGLPRIEPATAPSVPRPVFLFFINRGKVRAPAAAQALIARL